MPIGSFNWSAPFDRPGGLAGAVAIWRSGLPFVSNTSTRLLPVSVT